MMCSLLHRIILPSTLSFVHLIVLNFCECFNFLFAPPKRISGSVLPLSSTPFKREPSLLLVQNVYSEKKTFLQGLVYAMERFHAHIFLLPWGRKELSFLPFIENQNPINCGNSFIFSFLKKTVSHRKTEQ